MLLLLLLLLLMRLRRTSRWSQNVHMLVSWL
jgi:hypothetical protein